ncbi:MAG TPA: hypothetical protein VF000_07645 [Agromyces sp.]|jgi:magnesium-transporting ATPase (P-type)
MAEAQARRPVGIAVVAVLALISGVIDIITGMLVLFGWSDPDTSGLGGSGGVLAHSIGSMVVGVIVVVLSLGLWTGWPVARMVITVLQALSLIQSLFLAVAYLGNPVGEWASVLLSAIVLILLWTRPASAWFEARGATAQ